MDWEVYIFWWYTVAEAIALTLCEKELTTFTISERLSS